MGLLSSLAIPAEKLAGWKLGIGVGQMKVLDATEYLPSLLSLKVEFSLTYLSYVVVEKKVVGCVVCAC